MTKFFAFIIILLLITMSGCTSTDEKYIHETGSIIYLDFEGGFYGIVGDDSVNYDPSNLPKNFEKDEMRVKFIGKIDGGDVTHMWGIGIELIYIEKLYFPYSIADL